MTLICMFDVDGTLTPARQPMEEKFEVFFRDFIKRVPTYLVSGSDYSKLEEQVPQDILHECGGVFGCSGAEYYKNGKEVYRLEHNFSTIIEVLCKDFIGLSTYQTRCGNHIERRPGMLNVSVVGRNATMDQRAAYYEWDKIKQERAAFADMINRSRIPYEASAGGEISIDIAPTGWNKAVVKGEILKKHPNANLIFFGDRICEGGNDMPLAGALEDGTKKHKAIGVNGYADTWQYLATLLGTLEDQEVAA